MRSETLLLTLSVVVVCLLAAGCERPTGQAATVLSGDHPKSAGVSCLGRIEPGDRVIRVSAPPQSIVRKLLVQRGANVRQGQGLAVLGDYEVAAAGLAEANEEIAVAESIVAQTKAGAKPAVIAAQESATLRQRSILQNASKNFERMQQLFQSGLTTAMEFESAKLTLENAQQDLRRQQELARSESEVRTEDVRVAEQQLDLAKAKAAHAKADLDLNRIVAPVAGTVLEINTYAGESVSDRGILDLGDTRRMFVEAEVYISDVPRVHSGGRATVTGEGFAGVVSGKVVEILNQVSNSRLFPGDALTASDKRVLTVRISLDAPEKVQHLTNSEVSVHIEP